VWGLIPIFLYLLYRFVIYISYHLSHDSY
jgi:hypothetical protein